MQDRGTRPRSLTFTKRPSAPSKQRPQSPTLVGMAGAVVRWIGKVMRSNPGFRDERAAALEVGLNKLSSPH